MRLFDAFRARRYDVFDISRKCDDDLYILRERDSEKGEWRMVEVKRKRGETFDALLRRFQRRFQQSGKNIEMKRRRFHDDGKNRNQQRESALRREQKKSQYEYLMKTGQLKEEPLKKRANYRKPGV